MGVGAVRRCRVDVGRLGEPWGVSDWGSRWGYEEQQAVGSKLAWPRGAVSDWEVGSIFGILLRKPNLSNRSLSRFIACWDPRRSTCMSAGGICACSWQF